ncbi:MAG: Ig-like domain-containing protein, partial [Desulfosudaceae bacterium]
MRICYRFLILLAVSILIFSGCKEDHTRFTINGKIADPAGQGVAGVTVQLAGPESRTTDTNGRGRFSFRKLPAGEYTVNPVAADLAFAPATRTITLNSLSGDQTVLFETTAANQPPVAEEQSVTTAEDTAVDITLAGTDPDGDALTYHIIADPACGQIAGTPPDITYLPDDNYAGSDSFAFVASDGRADSAPGAVTIQITPVNDPPQAVDDVVTAASVPVTIASSQLLANDSDPDGDFLFVTGVDQPGRGVVLDNGDGTYTYTPGVDFAGRDSFTYTLSDGSGGTAVAEVVIQIRPLVTLMAKPDAVTKGEAVTLTWTSQYADTGTIEPGLGEVPASGSAEVVIEDDTTFTLTAAGPGGTATASAEVSLKQPPRISLSITPEVIQHGETAVLNWEAATADTVYFNQDIGPVAPTGSMTISPDYTTTYACTAVKNDLSTHQSVSVKVLDSPPPEAPPERTFARQYFDLIPDDVSLAAYNPERFVVLTGEVRDADGKLLPGVTVEVFDHPEY